MKRITLLLVAAATAAGVVLPTVPASAADAIRPFKVQVPQAALDDLHRRIAATR